MSSSARSILGDETFSAPTSPASQSSRMSSSSLPTDSRIAETIAPTLQAGSSEARGGTAGPLVFVKATKAHGPDDSERWEPATVTPTFTERDGTAPSTLISSSEDSPAKTYQSPGSGLALPVSVPVSSTSLHALRANSSDLVVGCFPKTSPVSSRLSEDGIFTLSSKRWPTSGFMTSRGEYSTPSSSEFPSDGGVSSSLPDVLQASVPPKYFLSAKAAAGIIRRATKRGKALPVELDAALHRIAGSSQP